MGREFRTVEDEFELSLELSIGGCYAKSETKSLEREKGSPSDGDDNNREISRSDFACEKAITDVVAAENGCEFFDLQKRREMQAMKRREARMKREFKKSRGMNGGGFVDVAEAQQQLHGRVEEREREGVLEEPARKREKSSFGENKVSWGDYGRRQMQAQFLLPVGNGFACPWVVPLLGSHMAAGERDEGNSGEEPPGNVAASSSGRRSSSAVSHHRSASQKGGSSSDTGSHSSSFGTHHNDKVEHHEVNNSLSRTEPPCLCIGSTIQEQNMKAEAVSASIQRQQESDTSKTGEGSAIRAHSNLTDTTCSTTDKPSSSPTSSVIKPPHKVSNPSQDGDAPPLPMPCVSTTGNGPNGRTITGFLYKYTKSEVSIMCVCHGSFFSPAEFVEHAGGVDVRHPLRHITVVPSAVR